MISALSDSDPALSHDRFLNLCRDTGLPCGPSTLEDEAEALLEFLNQQGVVLYVNETGLRDLVVLNPLKFLVLPATRFVCNFFCHLPKELEEASKKNPNGWQTLQSESRLTIDFLRDLWSEREVGPVLLPIPNHIFSLPIRITPPNPPAGGRDRAAGPFHG